jgi:hypothetical protein
LAFSENFNLVGIHTKFLGQAHRLAVARLENAGKGHDAILKMDSFQAYTFAPLTATSWRRDRTLPKHHDKQKKGRLRGPF